MASASGMQSYKLTQFGAPLSEVIESPPAPKGAQVLLRVSACGVCHSDLHIADGYFDLGQGQKLDLAPAVKLPRILGHEIAGIVEELGPDATGVKTGDRRAVYAWGGCDPARNAGQATRIYAPSHETLACTPTAGSAITFSSSIQDISLSMNRFRRRSPRPLDARASRLSAR
jgi:D-arabinose 1-dehydrogenase-like Zn-dependent alcohol dehydrogenase